MGVTIIPERQSFSFSLRKERLRPIVPANINATHKTPEAIPGVLSFPRLREKIKIMIIRTANRNIKLNISLVLTSDKMSFQTIVPISLKYFFIMCP